MKHIWNFKNSKIDWTDSGAAAWNAPLRKMPLETVTLATRLIHEIVEFWIYFHLDFPLTF